MTRVDSNKNTMLHTISIFPLQSLSELVISGSEASRPDFSILRCGWQDEIFSFTKSIQIDNFVNIFIINEKLTSKSILFY